MHDIVSLPRQLYKGYKLIFSYHSELYYDVRIRNGRNGFSAEFVRMPFPTPKEVEIVHRLYEDRWSDPRAYGIFDGDHLIAVVEIAPERWAGRLRITRLFVDHDYRGHGIGTALLDFAKSEAAHLHHLVIVLETESCNATAIDFYLSQGFLLSGFDAYRHSTEDVERKEVCVELGFKMPRVIKSRAMHIGLSPT